MCTNLCPCLDTHSELFVPSLPFKYIGSNVRTATGTDSGDYSGDIPMVWVPEGGENFLSFSDCYNKKLKALWGSTDNKS